MKKINYRLFPFLLFFYAFSLLGQQTVGVFLNTEEALDGYTLLAPSSSPLTYLMDNCGYVVHSWESAHNPGKVAYLLENGDLLRPAQIPNVNFQGGGSAGKVEIFNWQGAVIWNYVYSDSTKHSHHDVEYMPNGNILLIAWEYRSMEEAIENGRNPALLQNEQLWPTRLVELKPLGINEAEVVWEWHLWDHLVQDFDSTKLNYGVISEHPELMNINFTVGTSAADWVHVNSVDYNEKLDQIVFGSRHLSEIYIIDHSTSIEEAAGHTGGKYGKGGDFLYRYGNPMAYNQGELNNRTLYGQHDVHWIQEDYVDGGKLMVYNNGLGRPEGQYSTVEIINPPMDENGNYFLNENGVYGPDSLDWIYPEIPDFSFFSTNISGANRLENGNTLICEGRFGEIFEVNPEGEIVWSYVNPLGVFGPTGQGNPPIANSVFQAYRYAPDYPAFENKELIPSFPLEFNPWDSLICNLYPDSLLSPPDTSNVDTTAIDTTIVDTVDSALYLLIEQSLHLFPNPFEATLNVSFPEVSPKNIEVFDWNGRLVFKQTNPESLWSINTQTWASGIYFVKVWDEDGEFRVEKVVKQ